MKAACYHGPLDLSCEHVAKPECASNNVMVKVAACGICGSDLHFYKLGLFSEVLGRPTEKGLIPGHEFGGEVVEVGDQVKGIAVGDRVTGIAAGAMAEYVPISPAILGLTVYKLPDEVGYEEAATLEPLATSYHATKLGNPAEGQSAVIFGAGIIGLGIVQSLNALGINLKNLIVVDVSQKRMEMAKQLGATHIIKPDKDALFSKCKEIAGEAPLIMPLPTEAPPAVDVVYDAVGYIQEHPGKPVVQQATEIVREFGRVVVVGVFEGSVTMDFMPFVAKQITLRGSFGYMPDEVKECIELIRTKRIDRMPLISHTFSIDQAKEAFDTQCKSGESIKVLVEF